MRWLFRTDFRSFYLLNATQFLGALNDNVFKLLVVYLLINIKGASSASSVLSLAGAVFVVPFLLFSSTAGVLADRLSKRTIVVSMKWLELLIMLFGVAAITSQSEISAYATLFFMGAQSAFFGPSKYGIITELVEPKMVSKANGSLTSLTYLSIIVGTFLASFLTDITHKNFVLESLFCVLISIAGLMTSFGIRRTPPQNSKKKINPIVIYEVYQTLKMSWKIPHLLPAIYGSSFFLFVGAFAQLNIIPFAIQSLHLSEVGGGYLFLMVAVGIAVGSVVAGRLSKDKIEPGISCLSGFFLSIFLFLLYLCASSLILVNITLFCLGFFGGAYLVPLDSFVQVNSPNEKRGQVIATANFLSFFGVLLASFALFFISDELGFSSASGFAVMSVLTFISNTIVTGRLSELFLPYFAKKILKRFRKLKLTSQIPDPTHVIILQSNSWWDALLLFSYIQKLKILIPGSQFTRFPWINGFIDSIRLVPPDPHHQSTLETLFGQVKRVQNENCTACLFLHRREDSKEIIEAYKKVIGRLRYHVVFARIKKEAVPKKVLFLRYNQKIISLQLVHPQGERKETPV